VALGSLFAGPAHAQSLWEDPGSREHFIDSDRFDAWRPVPAERGWPSTVGMPFTLANRSMATPLAQDRGDFAKSGAVRPGITRSTPRSRWLGAAIGGVIGALSTYAVLNSGQPSTQTCNRAANQDAVETKYCVGLYVLGGVAGAGIGWVVSEWIFGDR